MGMLKGDSNALNFDQLMAQATQVAKQQDASLMERARQKRREDDEKRRRQEREQREKEEQQALLHRKRELQDKKQKLLMDQEKKKLDSKRRMENRTQVTKSRSTSSTTTTSTPKSRNNNIASFLPEKKKPVHMSFDDLMKHAKEQSVSKGGKQEVKAPLPLKKYASHDVKSPSNNTPTLYHRLKRPEATKSSPSSFGNTDVLSARDRAKLLVQEPPKKVNSQKRDRRSISDVQREIRRSKGIYSDEEDDRTHNSRQDSRLMNTKSKMAQINKNNDMRRKRPVSPPPRPIKKPMEPPKRPVIQGPRRMPFSGRPLDPGARKPIQRRRPTEEEDEEDEELSSFIVDDEDEDPRYARGPRRNSYSDEISKIFRYDKSRYANESVYSDDDMEADASDVLREEKRSERLARREDLLEEQRELERLKKRKKNLS